MKIKGLEFMRSRFGKREDLEMEFKGRIYAVEIKEFGVQVSGI